MRSVRGVRSWVLPTARDGRSGADRPVLRRSNAFLQQEDEWEILRSPSSESTKSSAGAGSGSATKSRSRSRSRSPRTAPAAPPATHRKTHEAAWRKKQETQQAEINALKGKVSHLTKVVAKLQETSKRALYMDSEVTMWVMSPPHPKDMAELYQSVEPSLTSDRRR